MNERQSNFTTLIPGEVVNGKPRRNPCRIWYSSKLERYEIHTGCNISHQGTVPICALVGFCLLN